MIHTIVSVILILLAVLWLYVTYDDDASDRTLK